MSSCPTVQIQDGKGSYIVINQTDYDSTKHKLFKPRQRRKVKAIGKA